jgi:dTDP-4-dehydrorhamnose reductase
MKVLLFGSTGKVGSELADRLPKDGHNVVALTRKDGDLSNPFIADKLIELDNPEVVINATAFNGLEACAKEPELAFTINSAAVAHMAIACSKINALFIHLSTDYVFTGHPDKRRLTEEDPVKPCGIYGFTKRAGEEAALAFNSKTLVLRLSSIYGRTFSGPIDAIRQAKEGKGTQDNPILVLHQICCPTSARVVADAIAKVLLKIAFLGRGDNLYGIYHLATTEPVWKKRFSESILIQWSEFKSLYTVCEGTLPIARPIHTALDSSKFISVFGYDLPTWRQDFAATLPFIK